MDVRSLRRVLYWSATLLLLAVSQASDAAAPAPRAAIPYKSGAGVASLAGLADTDRIAFAGGRTMSVGDARRLDAIGRHLRTTPRGSRTPPGLSAKPGIPKVTVATAADLKREMKRPDADTIQLPSGRRATVAQLKLLVPLVERRLGRPLEGSGAAPDRSGRATAISAATTVDEWKAIFAGPDRTVLVSPHGKRLTAGELKAAMKQLRSQSAGAGGRTTPALPGTTPAAPTPQLPAGRKP